MNDNPLDRIPAFDRISIRAVVVADGENANDALAKAGIVDPITVPVVFGEEAPSAGFGDGMTPNVVAVLEFDPPTDSAREATRDAAARRASDEPGTS